RCGARGRGRSAGRGLGSNRQRAAPLARLPCSGMPGVPEAGDERAGRWRVARLAPARMMLADRSPTLAPPASRSDHMSGTMSQIVLVEETGPRPPPCHRHPETASWRGYRVRVDGDCGCPEGRLWLPPGIAPEDVADVLNVMLALDVGRARRFG